MKTYTGGDVSYMDNFDLDKMSLLELDDILKRVLKYGNRGRYYAKWEGNNDLLLIHTDSLMMKFLSNSFRNVDWWRCGLSIQLVYLLRLIRKGLV